MPSGRTEGWSEALTGEGIRASSPTPLFHFNNFLNIFLHPSDKEVTFTILDDHTLALARGRRARAIRQRADGLGQGQSGRGLMGSGKGNRAEADGQGNRADCVNLGKGISENNHMIPWSKWVSLGIYVQ